MLQMQASNVAIDDHSVISLGRRHVVLHHRVTECDRTFPSPPKHLVVVVTFFNHNFVNCKVTLILAIKIYRFRFMITPGGRCSGEGADVLRPGQNRLSVVKHGQTPID